MTPTLASLARSGAKQFGRPNEMKIRRAVARITPDRSEGDLTGAYHVTPWKAGSQVIRAVLFDPQVTMYSGLTPDHLEGTHARIVRIGDRPDRHVSSTGFATPDRLTSIDADWNDGRRRVAAVVREPLSLLGSWYRSNLYTHEPNPDVMRRREALTSLSETEGLLASIDDEFDLLIDIMVDWSTEAISSDVVRVFRFEDLFGDEGRGAFASLLQHLGATLPDPTLERVLRRYGVVGDRTIRVSGTKYEAAGREKISIDDEVESRVYSRYGDRLDCLPYDR